MGLWLHTPLLLFAWQEYRFEPVPVASDTRQFFGMATS
jgi:hypothetical protein